MTGFYKGAAKRIEDVDLPRVAHEIGVGEDEIKRNSGFKISMSSISNWLTVAQSDDCVHNRKVRPQSDYSAQFLISNPSGSFV